MQTKIHPLDSNNYQHLTFPLNVYAHLLELDNKPVDYLHFGLFQFPDEDVYTAQSHSTEKILQLMPSAPAEVLEIGMGLGTLQKILHDAGYQAQGMTPDPAQYAIAVNTNNPHATLHCTGFEEFSTDDQFQVIISQESAQYIDILHLLPRVASLLDYEGCFILIDEVCLNACHAGNESLHTPSHIKFLANSLGFTLRYEEDLSENAQYTMEYLHNKLTEHHDKILTLIDNNQFQLEQLYTEIKRYIDCYRTKQYGYSLMVFSKDKGKDKNTTQNKMIRYLTETDLSDFQGLFKSAFAQSMDKILWQWKYKQTNVHSVAHSIGYWLNSQLIGHYGGFVRDILFFGETQQAIQIGDTMVAPHKRAMLTKNGIFSQLARIFLHRFVGYGTPYLLGFGFPNARVMKLAETLQLYSPVGRITRLSWTGVKTRLKPLYKIRPVLIAEDKTGIDTLWQQMAQNTQKFIIGVRDGQRIDYRYQQHPEKNYTILKVQQRVTNKLVAVLVLLEEDEGLQLIDFVCPLQTIPLVLYAALRFCQQQKQTSLFCHISDNLKPYFNTYTYKEGDPQIVIPHSICTPGPTIESIKDKWWLMGGDSDFM